MKARQRGGGGGSGGGGGGGLTPALAGLHPPSEPASAKPPSGIRLLTDPWCGALAVAMESQFLGATIPL